MPTNATGDKKMHRKPRILFVLKHRENGDYGCWNYQPGQRLSSGLHNSVVFLVDMLNDMGIEAKMTTVIDNNHIDRHVSEFKPTHCIIEAFWVVPEKFDVLKTLHPKVTWIVRDHSKTEFLAQEGNAFKWTLGYLDRGVRVACNSPEAVSDLKNLAEVTGHDPKLVVLLPNYYPINHGHCPPRDFRPHSRYKTEKKVHIGCFGAIRPFKNQVSQALAALDFVNDIKGKLRFHINATRIEGGATPMLNNLRGIFDSLKGHKLVEHAWMEHHDFKKLLARMDLTTQVSYSETFNIVAADSVDVYVPVVGSKEIPWLPEDMQADPSSVKDIAKKMRKVWLDLHDNKIIAFERKGLHSYSDNAWQVWKLTFGG